MIRASSLLAGAAWLGLLVGSPSPVPCQAPDQGTPGAAALPQETPPPVWTAQERKAIDLLRSLRSKERPSDEVLAQKLAEPGETLLGLLFQVLAQRSVPAHDGGAPQKLSEIQENVILLAVALLDREKVTARVGLELARPGEPGVRAAALGFVGAVGHANDLPALFELALVAEEQAPEKGLEAGLRRAVASILRRDPRAYDQLIGLRRIMRPELLPTLLSAVGEAKNGRGLAFLSEVSYWNEDLILQVMAQVRLIGLSGEETIDDGMRNRLRPYLDASRPGHCRAAMLALTTLKDNESIAALIELLSSETKGLQDGALWSLRTLTGLKFDSPQTWARWHQAELFWLVREKAHQFRRLRSNDAADAAAALRTILLHPLARDELCSALPDLLKNRWPAIRVLACRSLADLQAKESVPKLVWALEDRVPEVAQAAYGALKQLTGLDLPSDPAAWQVATGSGSAAAEL